MKENIIYVYCAKCNSTNRVNIEKSKEKMAVCGRCKEELNLLATGFPIETNDISFQNDVERSGVPTLVDFYAVWCGPCKMMDPIFNETAKLFTGKVRFVRVDIDKNPYLTQKYSIKSVPTLILFRGIEAGRTQGALTKENLIQFINRFVS